MNTLHGRSIRRNIILMCLVSVLSFSAYSAPVKKTLIVYFSQPENINLDGADGSSGASVLIRNNHRLGATQYIAQVIQQHTHGELFRIETAKPYPLEHEPLIRYAEQEQKNNVHPELKTKLENISEYDVIFIGYPNWWYNMPMAIYSFFEQNDFSGKTIIPFTTHGGSGFSSSITQIKNLQPNANVVSNGLAISREDVGDDDTEENVIEWLDDLSLSK